MMQRWIRSRLNLRTTLMVLGVTLGLGILADQALFRIIRARAFEQQRESLESLLEVVRPTAEAVCRQQDEAQARQIVNGLLASINVQAAELRTTTRRLARASRGTQDPAALSVRTALHAPGDNHQIIGELEVVQDAALAAGRVARYQNLVRLMILGLSLLAGAVLSLALRRSITGPIGRLSRQLHDLHPDAPHRLPVPDNHRFDEIGVLVRDVNALLDRQAEALQTERRFSEQREADIQRMNLVVLMGAGLAHDFNNLLSLVSRQVESGHGEEALASLQRAGALGRRIMDLGRTERIRELFDLEAFVASRITLLRHLAKLGVDLIWVPGGGEAWVEADPLEVEQILINLVVNARDALHGHGQIRVGTVLHGDHACMVVTDTGPGMAPETLARIFEPFFTTKAPGKGTGLGLASVRTLVEGMQGEVRVESTLGAGTSFTVLLPCALPEGSF